MSDTTALFRELEDPITDLRDMANLCRLARRMAINDTSACSREKIRVDDLKIKGNVVLFSDVDFCSLMFAIDHLCQRVDDLFALYHGEPPAG